MNAINKRSLFILALSLFVCVVVILALPTNINVNWDGDVKAAPAANSSIAAAPATTQAVAVQAPVATTAAQEQAAPADSSASSSSAAVMTDTKEIIDKYTLLVNKFKKEKPAYKKKEFQVLPEEYRNLGTAGNVVLEIAAGYIVSEEECEELVRPAGSAEEIKWDMPIHNTEVGCVLTNYDAVINAKCEDLGDGTYKISFSLKEEMNAEPTPADTLVPQSVHGAVMQPLSRNEITTEVEKITSKVPGLGINDFSLGYRDCVFECIYNPATDEVKSITHHVVIDINADIQLFVANIAGSARLLNEMYIYDITW